MDVLVKACAGILAYAGTRKKRCAIYGFLVQSNLKSLMPNVLQFSLTVLIDDVGIRRPPSRPP